MGSYFSLGEKDMKLYSVQIQGQGTILNKSERGDREPVRACRSFRQILKISNRNVQDTWSCIRFVIKVGSGVTDWTKGHGNALLMEKSVLGTLGGRNNGRLELADTLVRERGHCPHH